VRILVTGGAGFLGSHLCNKLLALGHEVLCLDNFYTGSMTNIAELEENPRFKLIEHDITLPLEINVDGIFNLACPASPVHYQRNPVKTFETSILGARNMLQLARTNGARILQASTSEIYGDPKESPQSESYWGNVNPIGVRACYDEGKRAAETLSFDYKRQFQVDSRVARIFNTYGPKMDMEDGRVVSNFIVQALREQNITIYGNGLQVRSFCYVNDLIDGLIRVFFKESVLKPINLGNPEPVTMLDLANEIIMLTDSKSKLEFKELPEDDPLTREPNIDIARKELGWEPKISRKDGILATIEYFKTVLRGS
jgi:UDP-glucuronate decarboxylase